MGAQPSIGCIDDVRHGWVQGWAREGGRDGPARLLARHPGAAPVEVLADGYRPDLAAAGLGEGRHAFRFRLDTPGFDPARLELRFADGTPVRPSAACLAAWQESHAAPAPADLEALLESPVTRVLHWEMTRQCNLRCTYCAVSQPNYRGEDMDLGDFDALVATLRARRVQTLVVNGHGETTGIPGWHHRILALAAAGFRLAIISNFARLLREEELDAMARIASIQVSVDTHRPEVLRAVRRRVDLGNILLNMNGVRARAEALGLPQPVFAWSCVMSDKVALDFADYLRFGIAAGVRAFDVCNLSRYPDLPGVEMPEHATTLPDAELLRFADVLREGRALAARKGVTLTIQAGLLDTLRLELARRGLPAEVAA
ncbi:radical SAM protein [Paracraurococcus lichenis]|uniref:Radical SAM protein n=1 Tax=Paracraurococcus lichenis TaxID=3064888 RepID=A0ABT9DSG2_9PROT|nr:radical SAM protein [Paracraurococcus sp. LOR1-02]MDO9706840.1 radical SAM protein [Paracraurococcus sp. LOR1-02]